MNISTAASSTIAAFDSPPSERDMKGRTINHAVWMLVGISLEYVENEKAHRWLGYAQALIVRDGLLTLGEIREINKRN